MTSFLFFLEEYRAIKKSEGLTGPDVSKQAGVEWRNMTADNKKKYSQMQDDAQAKYKKDMEEYLITVRLTFTFFFRNLEIYI